MGRADRRTFLQGATALERCPWLRYLRKRQELRAGKQDLGKGGCPEKPKPVITGPSQAQGIAKFAARTRYEDLASEGRERLKMDILDLLGCAIGALGAYPNEAFLALAKDFGGRNARCTLIGGGQGERPLCWIR